MAVDVEGNTRVDVEAGAYDTGTPTELTDGTIVVGSKRGRRPRLRGLGTR